MLLPSRSTRHGVLCCCCSKHVLPQVLPPNALHTNRIPLQISGIAISPDAYHDWPHDLNQMLQWAFEPASEDVVHALIDAGARDAKAWAADHDLLSIVGHSRVTV